MDLKKIEIQNYRSITDLTFEVKKIGQSHTFCLLGINESGKTSFLESLKYFEYDTDLKYPDDYFDTEKPIIVKFHYELTQKEITAFIKHLKEVHNIPKEIANQISFKNITYEGEHHGQSEENFYTLYFDLKTSKFLKHTYSATEKTILPLSDETEDPFDLADFINQNVYYFWGKTHKIVLWKPDPQYMLLEGIDLNEFSESPREISIPVYNCFRLAGFDDKQIEREIAKLTSSVAISNLQDRLSTTVSDHINKIWPEHPISLKFLINKKTISLLIEDHGVKFKAKTPKQRSDGFRQFISFLLTVSVENINGELSNTILLIDEPETHLHPQAQINLLRELINLTKNKRNNYVFFATHSNYLIDKTQMDRCYMIKKIDNEKTEIEQIKKVNTTYSEVNYDVFNIPTTDYHNELYGYAELEKTADLKALSKDRDWYNDKLKKTEKVSLPTYIRHSIHHPENNKNRKFREDQLRKSIEILRDIKYD